MRVIVDPDGKNAKQEIFAERLAQRTEISGRPADIQMAQDGSILVADDWAGAIYRSAIPLSDRRAARPPAGWRPRLPFKDTACAIL